MAYQSLGTSLYQYSFSQTIRLWTVEIPRASENYTHNQQLTVMTHKVNSQNYSKQYVYHNKPNAYLYSTLPSPKIK